MKPQPTLVSKVQPEIEVQRNCSDSSSITSPAKCEIIEICVLTENDLFDLVRLLLLKINIITGWPLPQDEGLLVLIDQLQKHLREKYPRLTGSEIERFFRSGEMRKQAWGQNMSIYLIDEYLQKMEEERSRDEFFAAHCPQLVGKKHLSTEDYKLWCKAVDELQKKK